jgi:ferrous iron transport protein B
MTATNLNKDVPDSGSVIFQEHSTVVEKTGMTFTLAGNPNCGKTSLFNSLTGAHQHVGNWGGVTVEVKEGECTYGGRRCSVVDLPGTYSLSAFSMEEKVARDFLMNTKPDVVINVIDATNLERNLYLTVQLMELGIRPLLAFNMWDEVQAKHLQINIPLLSKLLDVPIVTTIGKTGSNSKSLLATAFAMADKKESVYTKHLCDLPQELTKIIDEIASDPLFTQIPLPPQWAAMKLLENDRFVAEIVSTYNGSERIIEKIRKDISDVKALLGEDPESLIVEARYGFIAGALKETLKKPAGNRIEITDQIDKILTHQALAFPVFFFFMWLLFQATFVLGSFPMELIEHLISFAGTLITHLMPDSLIRSLIVDGIISGVGGVVIFLPNILILFFGIAIMEDTGYMARAAFITDRIMHKVGLHGKSFILMLMGLGCNVPAIMAARTLESEIDRRKTILLTPLISCSARLPVYVLFAGALFPKHAGNIIFLFQFVFGTLSFFIMAYIFKKTLFKGEDHPFVMELPPYRLPTLKSVMIHMWQRAGHFLKKMGGVVLIVSVAIWALGKFPVNTTLKNNYLQKSNQIKISTLSENDKTFKVDSLKNIYNSEQVHQSYIGQIGNALVPFFKPLGFEWQEAVALLTGFVAKEVVVSSMGVLYATGDGGDRNERLTTAVKEHFTPLKGLAFIMFVLLYTPCIVTVVTVVRELKSVKWSTFSIVYQIVLAWGMAFTIYQGGKLIGLH